MIDLAMPGLVYRDKGHSYTHDGESLTSVTKMLAQFAPFDRDKRAKISARKEGVTVDEIKERWRESGRAGTRVHAYAEKVAFGLNPTASHPKEAAVDLFWQVHKPEPVSVEAAICWPKHGLGGTLDLLAKMDGLAWLLDYKTDANWWYALRDNLEPPVDHLAAGNYSKHVLQQSTYRAMLEQPFYNELIGPIDRMGLVALHDDGTFTLRPLVYLRAEVDDMMEAKE